MPMLEGTITINPVTGEAVTTGAAAVIFTVLDSAQDYGTIGPPAPGNPSYAAAREQIAVLARAIVALIPYIQTNAVVNTTVSTTGLATGVMSGAATAPTASAGSGTGTIL